MEVGYTLTAEDFEAYLRWGVIDGPNKDGIRKTRTMGAAVFGLMALVFALGGLIDGGAFLFVMAAIMAAFTVAGYLSFGPRMRANYVRNSMRLITGGKVGFLLGPRTAVISAEGFALSGPGMSIAYAWELVDRVVSTAAGVYVFVGAQSAHVIPRSAFGSHEEMQHFAQTAEAYLDARGAA